MFSTADSEDTSRVTSLVSKNICLSGNGQETPENLPPSKQSNNRDITFNMVLIKEFIFCIAVALTAYGALHNTSTRISKHPQPIRFFSTDSRVTDWYKGQLNNAFTTINKADVSFVMYYAPWDAECQYVREEFEKAAVILNNYVHFVAINCWSPGSECRIQHSKISSWPILIAYTVTSKAVFYKGPRDAHSMVNFLELIMKPLEKISSTEDLVNLLSICDAVAVGYTPMTDTSRNYNIWYNVALKSREFDTIGEICFGAVTSEELSVSLGVDIVPSARLMLWNATKEYIVGSNEEQAWNESSLLTWVLENFTQPVARIVPMWKKAFNFDRYVDGNPLLMLFTPLNPLLQQLPSYDLLGEVAMEYYNCKNNESHQWISELIKLQQMQRVVYQQNNFLKTCQEYKFKKPARKLSLYHKKEVISQNNKYPWNNKTYANKKNAALNFVLKQGVGLSKVIEKSDGNLDIFSYLEAAKECDTEFLPAEKSFYDNCEYCHLNEEKFDFEHDVDVKHGDIETTMLPMEDDPLSSENLIQRNMKHFCKLIKFAYQWGHPIYPAKVHSKNITHIEGLACAHNFTLNMIAVDSVVNHHFAEALGVDIRNKKDMTSVVILDSQHETQYVLSEEYSAKSLRDFIYNFTNRKLRRSLRSQYEEVAHTHYFGADGLSTQMGISENTTHVIDLTTRTFKKVVKTRGTVTLLAVCGGSCGASLTRALLSAARLLRASGVRVRPAKIDALRHDLPWHYTPDKYPVIIVFPADGDEAESRSYPSQARISVSGLVALALRSLGAPQYLRVRLALCANTPSKYEKKACLKNMKEYVTSVIGRNLKYWRQTDDKQLKDALFRRLQHLHRVAIHLSLIHTDDLQENNQKYNLVISSLSALSNHWDINISIPTKNVTISLKSRS